MFRPTRSNRLLPWREMVQPMAAISNQLFGDYFYQKYGLVKTTIDFDPVELYYATAQGRNPDLLEAIDRDLGKWIPDPNSPYYTTLGDWTPKEAISCAAVRFLGDRRHPGLLVAAAGMIFLLRQQVEVTNKKSGAGQCRTARERTTLSNPGQDFPRWDLSHRSKWRYHLCQPEMVRHLRVIC